MFIAQASVTLTDIPSNLNEAMVAVHNAVSREGVKLTHLHVARWQAQHGQTGKTLIAALHLEIDDDDMGVALSRFEHALPTSEGMAEFEVTCIDSYDSANSLPGAL